MAAKNSHPEEKEDFGSWMLVKKPVRKRLPRAEKSIGPVGFSGGGNPAVGGPRKIPVPSSGPLPVAQNKGTNLGEGSRFELLNQVNEAIRDAENVGVSKENIPEIPLRETAPITTVNLGDISQPITSPVTQLESFNLGKQSHNLRPNSSLSKTILKKKKVAKHNLVLQEVNPTLGFRKDYGTKKNTHQGKENIVILATASSCPKQATTNISHPNPSVSTLVPETPLESSKQDAIPNSSSTTPCGKIESSGRENAVCGESHGESLLHCGDPPDPCLRSPDGNMVRPESGTPRVGCEPDATQ